MVVRIRTGTSIRGALSYNEQKVRQHQASLILASDFGCDIEELAFADKLRRFQSLLERNKKINTNALHVSLNFSPDEDLSDGVLQRIAVDYMDRIGFGEQPFLVYRHRDAAHPHIHIVSVNVQPDGSPIRFHNLGREWSEPARKAIEQDFNLIRAEGRRPEKKYGPDENLMPKTYGDQEVKSYLSWVVKEIIKTYKFTNLDEFNDILRHYNIVADRGRPGSFMYDRGGMVYSMIQHSGERVGKPIKASDLSPECILSALEVRFAKNLLKKATARNDLSEAIGKILTRAHRYPVVIKMLEQNGIRLGWGRDEAGDIRSAHFVDFKRKVVFSHQELGIELAVLRNKLEPPPRLPSSSLTGSHFDNGAKDWISSAPAGQDSLGQALSHMLAQGLLAPSTSQGGPPMDEPVKKKRKKKRRL